MKKRRMLCKAGTAACFSPLEISTNVKSEGSFRSWLVRILINEALAMAIARKKKSRLAAASPFSHGDWLEGFPGGGPDPEQVLAKRESVGALMAHLVRLPAPLRSAIVLCDIGEHSIES
jgi:DNA-directed RNA polymerase specialized sigma24 family protein